MWLLLAPASRLNSYTASYEGYIRTLEFFAALACDYLDVIGLYGLPPSQPGQKLRYATNMMHMVRPSGPVSGVPQPDIPFCRTQQGLNKIMLVFRGQATVRGDVSPIEQFQVLSQAAVRGCKLSWLPSCH